MPQLVNKENGILARPSIYLTHCELVKCERCKDFHWEHAAVNVTSPSLFTCQRCFAEAQNLYVYILAADALTFYLIEQHATSPRQT